MRGEIPALGVLVRYDNQLAYRWVNCPRWSSRMEPRRLPALWQSRRRLGRVEIHTYHSVEWNMPPIGEVFVFQNARSAMMFKLTWGGG